jgi:hypothetical protein
MKKFSNLAIIILFSITSASILCAADFKDGFFGTTWEIAADQLQGFTKVAEDQDVSYYMNSEKQFKIFDTLVPYVVYGFYKQKFFAVFINIDSIIDFSKAKKYIKAKYGPPNIAMDTKRNQKTYTWKQNKVKIKLKSYESENNMKLSVYYVPLSRTLNEERLEAYHPKKKFKFKVDERNLRTAEELFTIQ